jgi:hypothetical protein
MALVNRNHRKGLQPTRKFITLPAAFPGKLALIFRQLIFVTIGCLGAMVKGMFLRPVTSLSASLHIPGFGYSRYIPKNGNLQGNGNLLAPFPDLADETRSIFAFS